MCGIAGVWDWSGCPDAERLKAMGDALRHRGPDDGGTTVVGPVGFVHRRLSIIDIAGSAQPMSDVANRRHVVFNGEILNYRDIRKRLDYPFKTNGDTEVLLALHATHGVAGVRELVGQFAYAILDEVDEALYLFRDPRGILPLYYVNAPGAFWFSSEIKGVLAGLNTVPDVDRDSVATYLQHRYVPAPSTLFSRIEKLPAGHYLRVTRAGVGVPMPYIADEETLSYKNDASALRGLDRALRQAVRRNLVADVPVGAFLSGGLDSSLLASLAVSERPNTKLLTFSAGFREAAWNELPHARCVANHLGTEHHEVLVGPEDFESLLEPLTWYRDAPISEPSDVAVHLLARTARSYVKVVLSGEGADELFGGYPKYRLASLTRFIGTVPAGLRHTALNSFGQRLPPSAWRLRTAARALAQRTESDRYDTWFSSFTAEEAGRLVGVEPGTTSPAVGGGPALRRMMAADMASWLPDNLLERADRMCMAASLEVRPPFLDPDVVGVSRRLTTSQLVRGQKTKWLLKEYARHALPAGIADRPKLGFRVPVGEWFRGHLRDTTRERLLDSSSFASTNLDHAAVVSLLQRHDDGTADEGSRIWSLLALEVWFDRFFRQAARGACSYSVGDKDDVDI